MKHVVSKVLAILAATIVAGAAPQPQGGGGAIQPTGTSPRIEKLKGDLAHNTPGVVEAFWTEMAREHTPIVEPVPGDAGHVLVTLVWRGTPDTTSVQGFGTEMVRVAKTDVWYATFTTTRDHRLWYVFRPTSTASTTTTASTASAASGASGASAADAPARQPDPLNPHRFVPPVADEQPASAIDHTSPFMNSSILVLPDAPASPWVDPRPGVAPGRVEERTYNSTVYGTPRRIWVYTPPASRTAARPPAGLIVCLWGMNYLNEIPVPTILDNLIAQGRLPPVAAVFVDNGSDRFQNFQITQRIAESLSGELIPWARANLHVPADPHRVIITGYSAAGLASTYVAFKHPELVANVLSQSGAFWRGFEGQGASDPEWLAHQYAAIPKRDTRFYIDVGGEETTAAGGTFKAATIHLRDVLVKKGYDVSYNEVRGGEHEFIHWRSTIADGLISLTSGWIASP